MYKLFFLIFLATACSQEDTLSRSCPIECWPEFIDKKQYNKGVCKPGKPICDENNVQIDCQIDWLDNFSYQDICDGLDNNCSGTVDDGYYPMAQKYYSDNINPCDKRIGVCKHSIVECIEGQLTCIKPDSYEEGEETRCDGLDNDCDGFVDNVFYNEFCFDDEFWKATNGICRPGLYQCVNKQKTCVGQVLPEEEFCNGIDMDCNGVIDDGVDAFVSDHDIVYIIDTSGSMCGYIDAIKTSLEYYTRTFQDKTNVKFAIIDVALWNWQSIPYIEMVSDFNDIESTINAISILGCLGSGVEPTIDALNHVCDINSNLLNLSFRENSNKIILLFGDEPFASVSNPEVLLEEAYNTCVSNNFKVYTWTYHQQDYILAPETGGESFKLTSNPYQLIEDFSIIITDSCQ